MSVELVYLHGRLFGQFAGDNTSIAESPTSPSRISAASRWLRLVPFPIDPDAPLGTVATFGKRPPLIGSGREFDERLDALDLDPEELEQVIVGAEAVLATVQGHADAAVA